LRLLMMINDLLDLSKIEAGRMAPEGYAVDVTTMIDDIVTTVTPQAEANHNAIVIDFERPIGNALTDGFKLSQCLLNLMSNALKFTKNGTVTLKARQEHRDGGVAWYVFDVIDTG